MSRSFNNDEVDNNVNPYCSPEDNDPLYLKVSIIEPILLACIYGSSFSEIKSSLQKMIPTSELDLREYIFYLIDNSFISYDGSKQIYSIETDGLDLLEIIYFQLEKSIVDYIDLTVKVR